MQRVSQRRTVRIPSPDLLRARAVHAASKPPPLTAVAGWTSLAVHAALVGVLTLDGPPPRATTPAREFVIYLEPAPALPVWDAVRTPPTPDLRSVIEPPPRPVPDPTDAEPLVPMFATADASALPPLDVEVEVILPSLEPAVADPAAGLDYWADVRARLAEALRETSARWRGGETVVIWVTIELDVNGAPVSIEIADDVPRALADALRHALRRAAPFAAPPPGAPRRARVPVRFAG